MSRVGSLFAMFALTLGLSLSVYSACFRVTNEIGPVGADKSGRQIFVQTLAELYGKPMGFAVTSEWDDSTVVGRLVVAEPMRTTFRIVFDENQPRPTADLEVAFLGLSNREFFAQFNPGPDASIHLRQDWEMPFSEFFNKLDEIGARTVRQMLAALGFRRFEVFHGAVRLLSVDLPEIWRPNIRWVG